MNIGEIVTFHLHSQHCCLTNRPKAKACVITTHEYGSLTTLKLFRQPMSLIHEMKHTVPAMA